MEETATGLAAFIATNTKKKYQPKRRPTIVLLIAVKPHPFVAQ